MHHHEILFDQKPTNGSGTNRQLNSMYDNKEIGRMATPSDPRALDKEFKIKFSDWGFKIDRLFEVAYRFYKRNENKAFHLGFDERNRMIALTMQAKFGNFDGSRVPDIGVLDLVGKRRQYEWSLLNGMTKTEAMTKFICELDEICPIFKAHAEAVKISSESRFFENDKLDVGGKIVNPRDDPDASDTNVQMSGMYAALCKQTHHQFKTYAQKQHPDEPDKQKHLIASLQEQYYQQYISQLKPKHIERNGDSNAQPGPYPAVSTGLDLGNGISETTPGMRFEESNPEVRNKDTENHIIDTQQKQATVLVDSAQKCRYKEPNSEPIGPPANNNSDIKCEDNNVQADISNEELNSELDFNPTDNFQSEPSPVTVQSQVVEEKSNPIHTELNESTLVEVVKLGHNSDLHPIATFESFPEPRLVGLSQRDSTPLLSLNPNLPARTLRPSHDNDRAESTEEPVTMTDAPSDQKDGTEPARPSLEPAHQVSLDVIKPNTTQRIATNATAHDTPHVHDDGQSTLEITDGMVADNIETESQVQCNQRNLPTQQPYEPELWGTISPDCVEKLTDQTPSCSYGHLEPVSTWTKRAVAEFKDSLGGDKQGGVYEVREGSVIVIQVPTYPDGKYIYWEFATDNHDIGFGVDFAYTELVNEPLALEIYQDDDEYDFEGPIEVDNWQGTPKVVDEAGYHRSELASERDKSTMERRRLLANRVPVLPTYRRDSHEEVYVGRHKYPGRGYYLLRFDNTYSVLRSKTLYFRICYFM